MELTGIILTGPLIVVIGRDEGDRGFDEGISASK